LGALAGGIAGAGAEAEARAEARAEAGEIAGKARKARRVGVPLTCGVHMYVTTTSSPDFQGLLQVLGY
jgi:hypothetical protein